MPDVKHPVGPSQLVERATVALEELMTERGVSAKRLSALSGVSDTAVGRVLRREMVPSLDTIDRLFAGLGHSVELEIMPSSHLAYEAIQRAGQQRPPGRPARTERSNIGSS